MAQFAIFFVLKESLRLDCNQYYVWLWVVKTLHGLKHRETFFVFCGELMELEVRRSGYPRTAQDAVKLAETALERVSSEMRRFTPKAPVSPVTGASSSRSVPAPESMLDAIKQAIRA